jgi:hypothetical protein
LVTVMKSWLTQVIVPLYWAQHNNSACLPVNDQI